MEIATKVRDVLTRAVRGIDVQLDDPDRFRLVRALSPLVEQDGGYLSDVPTLLQVVHKRPVRLQDEMGELAVVKSIRRLPGGRVVGACLEFRETSLYVKVERDVADGTLALWVGHPERGDAVRLIELESGSNAARRQECADLSF